jgi:hypothetical protein
MVIEFAPKPQLPSTVEKSAVPKKSAKADHAEVATGPKPAQTKAGKTDKETAGKNGELF